MKLRNKLLTALPICVIGATTPIVVSGCSCTKSITVNFGDELNCKEKKTKSPKYYSSDVMKASLVTKVQQISSGNVITWPTTGTDAIPQQFYWDLTYSGALYGYTYVLTGNKWTGKASEFTAKFNGVEFDEIKYEWKDGSWWMIAYKGGTEVKWLTKSFTYQFLPAPTAK